MNDAPPDGPDGFRRTRRGFLGAASGVTALLALGGLGAACSSNDATRKPARGGPDGGTPDGSTRYREPAVSPSNGAGYSQPSTCAKTADNIEGPFYKAGAPPKTAIAPSGAKGTPLRLSGRVTSIDCKPLAGATLDVWQADASGGYDNAGFAFRGVLATDASGAFDLETVIPGHYLNGRQYRPAHVHVKVSAAGHAPLTTQLYFEGDPYNGIDPFIAKSLIMKLDDVAGGGKHARFDFALSPIA